MQATTHRQRIGILSWAVILGTVVLGWGPVLRAQHRRAAPVPAAATIVMPQSRRPAPAAGAVTVEGVAAEVTIVEQTATVNLDIALKNPSGRIQEARLLVPVPDGVAIRGFGFAGPGKEPTAELLPKDKAVEIYNGIVARMKDPALLEFAGMGVVRSSVFPVPAGGTQKIRLTYEQLLTADGERVDFALPRSEAVDYDVPWTVKVTIKSKRALSTAYSPSHTLLTKRRSAKVLEIAAGREAMAEPGPLLLSYLHEAEAGVTASLLAYPDPEVNGGFFLLLAGLPAPADGEHAAEVKREVTIVLDRSGSMSGEKMAQAGAAALQVIAGLDDGEAFNVIDYSDSIASFARRPVLRSDESLADAQKYLDAMQSGGGTNIKDALVEALRPRPREGMLPIVLFLTDGLPTVGERSEVAIRKAVEAANKHDRRVFTFGVGYDVNAPLLSHLAAQSRATSTFVLPGEDVEVKVAQVYKRLYGPVLSSPELHATDATGEPVTRRVADVLPGTLPDLFEGDQLVVLGKYRDDQPLRFTLRGRYRGKPRTFKFRFDLDRATTRNGFVPRLWASRKIAVLIEAIRQAEAAASAEPSVVGADPATDPKLKELVDEITRLSLKYGILTEYTAFLAREGTELSALEEVRGDVAGNLRRRARERVGKAAINQSFNNDRQMAQAAGNRLNAYVDENLQRVQITTVQQFNDVAFFRKGGRWVDGRAVNDQAAERVDAKVTVGSKAFAEVLKQLTRQGRNGVLSLQADVLLRVGDKNILIEQPAEDRTPAPEPREPRSPEAIERKED